MTRFESYLNSLQRFGIKPGLERVHALLEHFGQPQHAYPIVLVGGTNGKGSTCEFLAKLLEAQGHKVGLYTSPHLYRWNERIRVLPAASKMSTDSSAPVDATGSGPELFPGAIADAELDALFDDALPSLTAVADSLGQPTEFETLTALGLWHFQRAEVDFAVVEVGLGGRWDATNATEPTVSVITHVALDHCDRLGNTVEEIASDKVEIARPQRILVTAETKPSVLKVFQDYCTAHEVRLWSYQAPESSNDKAALEATMQQVLTVSQHQPERDATPDFQSLNLATAAMAKAALYRTLDWQTETNVQASSSNQDNPSLKLAVPGRAEVLREAPLVIIDGANNPDGAARLANYLREKQREAPGRRLILVLGILADKDY
ncbi:MAG: hypothetical protein JOZ57_15260, partial [Abitibacteriaceae bacterium]|nr:hypothetical protein [Abditibacteriaceae bacterium]